MKLSNFESVNFYGAILTGMHVMVLVLVLHWIGSIYRMFDYGNAFDKFRFAFA